MSSFFDPAALGALFQVVAIDVALAGDNAVVVGMAAAGLPVHQRRRAILIGIAAAAILRILFASVTVHLLQIVGLMFAGGLLLLWVGWKLWRELRSEHAAGTGLEDEEPANAAEGAPTKSFRASVCQIVVADLSMSLDNVLAVAGAAREHEGVLILGLALSVGLMGLAASLIARLLNRHRWIAYVGLLIILYVALTMIWDGGHDLVARAADL